MESHILFEIFSKLDIFAKRSLCFQAAQMALVINNTPANARDVRDVDSIPGSGRFPRGGQGNPLQYSCLVNPMDRGAWWAVVHGVVKSRT